MPTYQWQCTNCPKTHTSKQRITELIEQPDCPDCGSLSYRLYSLPSISFKGPGFYSTQK